MAITPIALGVQVPQFQNPMEMYGNAMRLKSMQQQNALAEQQMAVLREEQQRNALMDAAYSGAFDPKTGSLDYNQLYSKVPGRMIPGLIEGRAKQQEAQFKADRERLGYAKDFMENVQAQFRPDMTLDEVMALRKATYDHPVVGPILLQSGVDPAKRDAETVAVFTPRPNETQEAFRQRTNDYIYGLSMGAAKFAEKLKVVSSGGEDSLVTPGGSRVATFQRTPTPGEVEQRRHNLMMEARTTIDPLQFPLLAKAVAEGRMTPDRVNSRNAAFLEQTLQVNPNVDLNVLAARGALMRNPSFQNKAIAAEAIPEVLQSVVAAGKKLNFSNVKFVAEVQKWVRGQTQDPQLTEYMTLRNDSLLSLAATMRLVGMSDYATKLEEEAAAPTMTPAQLDAYMRAQMQALMPRLKRLSGLSITGTSVSGAAPPSAPAAGGTGVAAPTGSRTTKSGISYTVEE